MSYTCLASLDTLGLPRGPSLTLYPVSWSFD
jgi:hypothetical protein